MKKNIEKTKKLTRRQNEIIEYLLEINKSRGYPPSIREICQHLNLHSSSTVHNHLCNLEKKGYIHREPGKPRSIKILKNKKLNKEIKKNIPTLSIPYMLQCNQDKTINILSNIIAELKEHNIIPFYIQKDHLKDFGINYEDIILVKPVKKFQKNDLILAVTANKESITGYYQENVKSLYSIKLKNGNIITETYENFIGKIICILVKKKILSTG